MNGRFFNGMTIMTIYHLPPLDDPRESITLTFSQEATEETEIEKNLSPFSPVKKFAA
jgi:hypothetical protein